MVEQTLKVQSRGGQARALNHVGHPIEAGRVKSCLGTAESQEIFSSSDLCWEMTFLSWEETARGTRESHVPGVLSYTLIFAVCLDWAGTVARIEWCQH